MKSTKRKKLKPLQVIKKGRRRFGGVYDVLGNKVFVAYRKTAHVFRGGIRSISEAIRLNKAAWAFEESTLLAMRAQGIKYVAVHVQDTGDIFLTTMQTLWDNSVSRSYSSRSGSHRYLEFQHFRVRAGKKIIL